MANRVRILEQLSQLLACLVNVEAVEMMMGTDTILAEHHSRIDDQIPALPWSDEVDPPELLTSVIPPYYRPPPSVRKLTVTLGSDDASSWSFLLDPSRIESLDIWSGTEHLLNKGSFQRLTCLRLSFITSLAFLNDCPVLEQFFLDLLYCKSASRDFLRSFFPFPSTWLSKLKVYRGPGSRVFGTILEGRPIRHLEIGMMFGYDTYPHCVCMTSMDGLGAQVESLRIECDSELTDDLLSAIYCSCPNLKFLEVLEFRGENYIANVSNQTNRLCSRTLLIMIFFC